MSLSMEIFIVVLFLLFSPSAASTKRGYGVNNHVLLCNDSYTLTESSWWYNWRTNYIDFIHDGCSPRGEFVPMVWSFQINYTQHVSQSSHYILGYNEPNERDQSNITPQTAASHWPEIERLAQGKLLVSPAPARCNGWHLCFKEPTDWLDEFFQACSGCRVDFLAAHTYNCDPDNDMRYLESLYNRYGKQIWLTEFSCPKTMSVQKELDYMKQIVPRLEAAPFIYRYAWYITRQPDTDYLTSAVNLLKPNVSELTYLGHVYNSLPAV
ncbi:alkali-sensitive linkage protein 1-like [Haliotis rubra]|uniref:alkali-sensitive linkage protein 1-like n=1 Tax=Haliotis rubra TaxID=36100 RepID=UPI001EE5C774|nr:alkali-sensitive linkage protein 1-like [Haliotis rubra]